MMSWYKYIVYLLEVHAHNLQRRLTMYSKIVRLLILLWSSLLLLTHTILIPAEVLLRLL